MTLRVYTENNVRPEPWMAGAACATTDPDMWFPLQGDQPTADRAKKVCRACPVREQCLEFALRTEQQTGIWAGLSPKSLRTLRSRTA